MSPEQMAEIQAQVETRAVEARTVRELLAENARLLAKHEELHARAQQAEAAMADLKKCSAVLASGAAWVNGSLGRAFLAHANDKLRAENAALLAENGRLRAQASYIVACEWRDKHSAAEAEAAELRERYAALRKVAGELAAALWPIRCFWMMDVEPRTRGEERTYRDGKRLHLWGEQCSLTIGSCRKAAEAYAAHAALLTEVK